EKPSRKAGLSGRKTAEGESGTPMDRDYAYAPPRNGSVTPVTIWLGDAPRTGRAVDSVIAALRDHHAHPRSPGVPAAESAAGGPTACHHPRRAPPTTTYAAYSPACLSASASTCCSGQPSSCS